MFVKGKYQMVSNVYTPLMYKKVHPRLSEVLHQ